MVGIPEGDEGPQIPRFYAGRDVFITGGSGFIGKVLVERLLSTCPDIGRLHLLMRVKKDQVPEKRLAELKLSPVFNVLKQNNPRQLDKICVVAGDITRPELGLSSHAMEQLKAVSVVFHSAAMVRFDEELPKAVEQNVLSVTRLLAVCDKLPALQVVMHVSTAFSQSEHAVVEEAVYPLRRPLQQLVELALAQRGLTPEETRQFISPKPNTYTYTKMLAESVIQQHNNNNYARAIFRPSIVISSFRNPFPGWIENLNGPSGVVVAVSKGLLHTFKCKSDALADMLPVDIAADTLLAAAWDVVTHPGARGGGARVYNCSSGAAPATWRHLLRSLLPAARAAPPHDAICYPFLFLQENRFMYKVTSFLLQTLPLHMAEYIYQIFNWSKKQKRLSFITIAERLQSMNDVNEYFTSREWQFRAGNVRRLRARLALPDARLYTLDPAAIHWKETYTNLVMGCRRHLMKESDDTIPAARRRIQRIYFLQLGIALLIPTLLIRQFVINQTGYRLVELVMSVLSLLQAALSRATSSFADACFIITAFLRKIINVTYDKVTPSGVGGT